VLARVMFGIIFSNLSIAEVYLMYDQFWLIPAPLGVPQWEFDRERIMSAVVWLIGLSSGYTFGYVAARVIVATWQRTITRLTIALSGLIVVERVLWVVLISTPVFTDRIGLFVEHYRWGVFAGVLAMMTEKKRFEHWSDRVFDRLVTFWAGVKG
jgi:hypothetical protein